MNMPFSKYFDHTILAAATTEEKLRQVCEDAVKYNVCSVAVNTGNIAKCAEFLKGSDVLVDAAVGFPLGITTVETKLFEIEDALKNGAGEIDYVVNIGKVKDGDFAYIKDEMERIVALCRKHGVVSKVIFENCYLTKEEIVALSKIALEVKPDFIKTSTGKEAISATPEAALVMCEAIKEYYKETGRKVGFKAAGGIDSVTKALAYYTIVKEVLGEEWLNNGLFRIGTSRLANLLLSDIVGEKTKLF